MTVLATVEVVRPTTTSSLTTAADLAAVVTVAAVAGLLGLLVLAMTGRAVPGDLPPRLRGVAAVAAAGAFCLRLAAALDSGAALGTALGSRRVLAHAAVLVTLGLLGVAAHPRAGLRVVERRVIEGALGVLAAVAMVLSGPRAGAVAALAPAAGAVVGAVVVAMVAVVLLRRRRPDGGRWEGVVALVVVAAVVGWPAAVQPSGHTSYSEELRVDGHVLYLTVAPATAGDNEVHLYVFDDGGRPQVVEHAMITVEGRPAVQLAPAGTGHLLAFGLVLPEGEAWPVTVEAETAALATPLITTVEVRADGT